MLSLQQLLSLVLTLGLCVPAWAMRDCCCTRRAQNGAARCCQAKAAQPAPRPCCAARQKPARPVEVAANPVCQCPRDLVPQAVRSAAPKVVAGSGDLVAAPLVTFPHMAPAAVRGAVDSPIGRPPWAAPRLIVLCRSLA
jgi:hypothetical protein